MEKMLSNFAALIPQVFYDIIGRVIPGMVFVGGTLLIIIAKYDPKNLSQIWDKGVSFSIFIGLLFIFYIVGALLGGIWFYLYDVLKRHKKVEREFNELLKSSTYSYIKPPIRLSFAYDHLHLCNPSAGSRIAKLRAEQHMCGVVIIGSFILLVINYIIFGIHILPSICFLFIIIAAWLLNIHLEKRFAIGLCNLWILTCSQKNATVAAIITKQKNNNELILLTYRTIEPFKGKWCLPGGHIDYYETAKNAIIREVKEETGLYFTPQAFKYFDEIIPEKNIDSIVIVFTGSVEGTINCQNDEVSEIKWFSVSECQSLELAFRHREIIQAYAIRNIENN